MPSNWRPFAPGATPPRAQRNSRRPNSTTPAVAVSGAPTVRAMEIIDELQTHRRGPYSGTVGGIDFTGSMETCIALQTLVIPEQSAVG